MRPLNCPPNKKRNVRVAVLLSRKPNLLCMATTGEAPARAARARPKSLHEVIPPSQLHQSYDPRFMPSSLGSYRSGVQAARKQFLVRSLVGEKISARVLSGSTLGVDFAHHIFESAAALPAYDAHGRLPTRLPTPANSRTPTPFANPSRADITEQRLSTSPSRPLQRLKISMSAPALAPAEPAADGACAAAGSAPAAGPSTHHPSVTTLTAAGPSTMVPLRNLSPPPGTPALFRPHSTHAAPPLDSLETYGKCALASAQWHEVHAASLTVEARRALREMRCADGSPLWAGMEEEEILAALEAGQLRCCPRYAVLMREGARAEAAFAILEGEVTPGPSLVASASTPAWPQPGSQPGSQPGPSLAPD